MTKTIVVRGHGFAPARPTEAVLSLEVAAVRPAAAEAFAEASKRHAALDVLCEQLGVDEPCTTAEEPLAGSEREATYWIGSRAAAREPVPRADELVCECELITRRRLEEAIDRRGTASLDDVRRLVRLAMGPCQGGFCIYRATAILHERDALDGPGANRALLDFLEERWKGVHPIVYGDQLRQTRLDEWIFHGVLGVEHLPR